MPKLTIDFPDDISKALEVHKLRFNLHDKRDACVDALKRFFKNEDFDYFLKEKKKI